MAEKEFDLGEYLANGVEGIVKGAVKATLKDPKGSAFMARYALASKEASKRRADLERRGEHIPPFLIASITGNCNLHCAGCYARENHFCSDGGVPNQLSAEEWETVFREAKGLGIGFILLAGGEPMLRKDVLRKAAEIPEILFPVFTNGTLIDGESLRLFGEARNLIPVFSIEGNEGKTDQRRGEGTYRNLLQAMGEAKRAGLLFGASVTVTTSNLNEIVSDGFVSNLREHGCKAVVYVEFVPVEEGSRELAPQDAERELLNGRMAEIRQQYPEMIFISFPGDEKSSGGCLAAGRGFFHINPQGGAEPCPFSPYSDINVRDTSIREALRSRLFATLQDEHVMTEGHAGGCVLFERRDRVESLLAGV